MEEIEVYDIVRVTDWGCSYSNHSGWFSDKYKDLDKDWVIRFAYGDNTNYKTCQYTDDTKYKVLYIADNKALIRDSNNWYSKVYLVGLDGLELYNKETEMTIEEIEEKLGVHNLRIVKKHDEENY